jgi:hypothetical protein
MEDLAARAAVEAARDRERQRQREEQARREAARKTEAQKIQEERDNGTFPSYYQHWSGQ